MTLAVRLGFALVVIAAVMGALNWLVFQRVGLAFKLSARNRKVAAAVLAVPLALAIFFRMFGSRLPVGFGEPFVVAASSFELGVMISGGLIGLGLLGLLAFQLGVKLRKLRAAGGAVVPVEGVAAAAAPPRASLEEGVAAAPARASLEEGAAAAPPPPPRRVTAAPAKGLSSTSAEALQGPSLVGRRAFVEQAAVGSALLVGGGSTAYGALFGRHDYELATVPVPIPGLSKAADGFTLVQISDIHLGQMVGEHEMRAAEELVRKAKGDLVVVTGDMVDHDPRYVERLGRLMRRLTAISPVVVIPGNHDYYTGAGALLEAVRAAGATTLVNQAMTMLGERGFVLAGLDDQRGDGPDLALALEGVRSDAPRIVLCHNPKHFEEFTGEMALQLSGHTHGGQINLGVRPADFVLRHGYIAGLYELDGSRLYVNRGFGTAGAAVRVGAPPEITRIVLVAS